MVYSKINPVTKSFWQIATMTEILKAGRHRQTTIFGDVGRIEFNSILQEINFKTLQYKIYTTVRNFKTVIY